MHDFERNFCLYFELCCLAAATLGIERLFQALEGMAGVEAVRKHFKPAVSELIFLFEFHSSK